MTESLAKNEEIAADPFAADIFAARRAEDAPFSEEKEAPESPKTPPWSDALPKVSARAAGWDELLRRLPPNLFDALPGRLAQTLAGFLNLPGVKAIEFSPLMSRETNRAEDFRPADSWWLDVGVETSDAEIAFEIDNAFAVWLTDAALGAEIGEGGQNRELTASERAALEFLALNLTHEANSLIKAPLFKFRAASREIPARLRRNLDSASPALLTLSWRAVRESSLGVVKMHVAPEDLRALQTGENQLLAAAEESRAARLHLPEQIKDVPARLRLGAAELSFAELLALEAGDVVLLENHGLAFDGANIFGRAEIFLGDDDNAKIRGELAADDSAPGVSYEEATDGGNEILVRRPNSKNDWRILIENLTITRNGAAPGETMAETEINSNGETNAENADEAAGNLAAENLAVTVRVEIATRRLSLAEIGNLRENQVLELGARPTDPVNLLVDDQKIGRGELVLIEDRLGVRITKLLR